MQPIVVVHGGAGNQLVLGPAIDGAKQACQAGYRELIQDKSALDAVEAAVKVLEDNPCFNAGTGSQLTIDGRVQMDASIMNGKDMFSGAVTCIARLKNPISIARLVMEQTRHCLIVGSYAEELAKKHGFTLVDEKTLRTEEALEKLQKYIRRAAGEPIVKDTVGAVALDRFDNIAAATSTGGVVGKMNGRVGDSPIIGSGLWAENETCSLSSTGDGENIMRVCLLKHISMMCNSQKSLQDAVVEGLSMLQRKTDGTAGVIGVNQKGEIAIHNTTNTMPWAYYKDDKLFAGGKSSEFVNQ